MSEKILNKWLPISQFPYTENDSYNKNGLGDTWEPNRILLYGIYALGSNNLIQDPQVWSLDYLCVDNEGNLVFKSETLLYDRNAEIIPTMYMEVTPPSEQEIEHAASS